MPLFHSFIVYFIAILSFVVLLLYPWFCLLFAVFHIHNICNISICKFDFLSSSELSPWLSFATNNQNLTWLDLNWATLIGAIYSGYPLTKRNQHQLGPLYIVLKLRRVRFLLVCFTKPRGGWEKLPIYALKMSFFLATLGMINTK